MPVVVAYPDAPLSQKRDGKPKRIRPSKKDIIAYPFTDEQEAHVAELIKSKSFLYVKRDANYLAEKGNMDRWLEIAETVEPVKDQATGPSGKKKLIWSVSKYFVCTKLFIQIYIFSRFLWNFFPCKIYAL